MEGSRTQVVSSKEASAYGFHPLSLAFLFPTIAFSIIISAKIFLFYSFFVFAQIVLKYYLKQDAKTFFKSIWKALFGSTRLTIRN